MVSVQFPTNFTGPSFCGGRTKRLQTFSRHFSWEQSSKYCIAEFTAIFVCLLLSGCRRYSMKWSKQLRRPVNLCPNIWFINNSKCQQFFHLKKQPPKKQVFHNFKRLFFRNGQPYWYEWWRVLWDFCGLSKQCAFPTFSEIFNCLKK